ncbi:MAG: spore coat protein CotJB [Oscillospiraceae bacterium]|nr:spore coat protein CotJB [Oscillospiraceae bacterium]
MTNNNLAALSRAELLRQIQMASFAVVEANLFLDTHPQNAEAIAYFNRYNQRKTLLCEEYTRRYGPLHLTNYQIPADTWEWVKGPWPWELEE